MISAEELLRRATAGLPGPDRKRMLRASNLYRVLSDPFGVWCDYHAPESERVEETTRYDEHRMRRGSEFEAEWVRERFPEAVEIPGPHGIENLVATLDAMRAGARAIHGGLLWSLADETYGVADLLERRDDAPSDLGPFHYRVKEVKRSGSVKDYHRLQAAFYTRILGLLQGCQPDSFDVVLKDGSENLESFAEVEGELKESVLLWRSLRDGKERAEPGGWDKTKSPWRVYANKVLQERKDLTLLGDVGRTGRESLRKKLGVQRIDDLSQFDRATLERRLSTKTARALFYKARAWREARPVLADDLLVAIPRAARNLYLDFETSDELHPSEPPHAYLIGIVEAATADFRPWIARGAADEERIFEEFLDFAGDPRGVRVYHWTDFEIGILREVASRHPRLASRIECLIPSCVDLHACLKDRLFVPAPSFSIKHVAPACGFLWRQEDVDAFESMVLYWDWLAGAEEEETIRKVLVYNEDDLRAMAHVDRLVTSLRSRTV